MFVFCFCIVVSLFLLCFFCKGFFLAMPTLCFYMLWLHVPEDTPHFYCINFCFMFIISNADGLLSVAIYVANLSQSCTVLYFQ